MRQEISFSGGRYNEYRFEFRATKADPHEPMIFISHWLDGHKLSISGYELQDIIKKGLYQWRDKTIFKNNPH